MPRPALLLCCLLPLACDDGKPGDTACSSTVDGDGDGYDRCQDCDDADATVFPGAIDCLDGLDNDCDGVADGDDAPAQGSWHPDVDGDGYGDHASVIEACQQPDGTVDDATDCDDGDPLTHPGASELCDGADDDCDGYVDEDAIDLGTWHADVDGDGYGDPDAAVTDCEQPDGTVEDATDCDDADPSIHPGAQPGCDGKDHDCDGVADNDGDGDGYSDEACGGDDCDDGDASTYPLAPEVCGDGVVNDCQGSEAAARAECWEELDLSAAQAKLTGEAEADNAGRAVAGAGDVNGDGLADLLIAALKDDTAASNAGAAFLFLAPVSGTAGLSSADAALLGEAEGDYAGTALAAAGDVDGDGLADLLIGAYGESSLGNNSGAAYLVCGPISGSLDLGAGAKWTGEVYGDWAGHAVAGVGDVNGDGLADQLVGAPWAEGGAEDGGAAYLLPGSPEAGASGTTSLSAAAAVLQGPRRQEYAGGAVAGAGDVDGDGLADLLVGAPHADVSASNAGAAYLVLGPVTGELSLAAAQACLLGEAQLDKAGTAVAGAGDVDGDGLADLLVGAPEEDSAGSGAGAVYLLLDLPSGEISLATAHAKLLAESSAAYAGGALAGGGDVNGDGLSDLLIGAEQEGSAGQGGGAAYLVLGPVTGSLDLSAADAQLLAESSSDKAGCAVDFAGDVGGDGAEAILVGAWYEETGGMGAGAAYLVVLEDEY